MCPRRTGPAARRGRRSTRAWAPAHGRARDTSTKGAGEIRTSTRTRRRRSRRLGAAATALAISLGTAGLAAAAPGDPDTSFDGDGRRLIDLGADDAAYGLAARADGRTVIAGFGGPAADLQVVQLLDNGANDTGFGTGGVTGIDFGGVERASAVMLQGDGAAVVVGHSVGADIAIARVTAGGALDPAFDGDGRATVDWGGADEAHGGVIQADGRILVVGFSQPSTGITVSRLLPDGSLDASFGTGGTTRVTVGTADRGRAIALQPDGKIVVVGSTGAPDADVAVARLTAGGAIDTTFGGGDGIVTVDRGGNDQAQGVAVQADGRIVISGYGAPGADILVMRLLPDGALDPGFGGAGVAVIDFGGAERGRGVALQANGKIVVAGRTGVSNDVVLARLRPDGVPDTAFSGDGRQVIAAPGDDDVLTTALSARGDILYGGANSLNRDMQIGRVLGDGPGGGGPAPNFGAVGGTPPGTLCATPTPTAAPSAKGRVALTTAQLAINQRIGQAAIRRLNAVENWLNAGIVTDDLCGGAIGRSDLATAILTGAGAAQALTPARPRTLVIPAARTKSATFTLTPRQLLINQRIYQAALRRARGLEVRLGRLTGGDVRDGAVSSAKLTVGLTVLAAPPTAPPARSVTPLSDRVGGNPAGVRLTASQLAINQRIAQAGVRAANELRARIETGLGTAEFADGSLTAADLAPGVAP